MRYTSYYIPTVKETPADAEIVSHQLMLRAGMMRQLARGIYDYLPLGLRVIRKVEQIVREEMGAAGSAEVLLPMVQPAELWRETDRWEAYKKEGLLATLEDRHEREYCLGPTHEEVITDLVRRDVRSYKELPISLFQIQTKFRDEIRPRFGLMRAREFIMKDAYTFDRDDEGAKKSYWTMFNAYARVFARCGLDYRPVEALTGNIGGSMSHEFQVLADSGEDAIAACTSCDYAANVEKAEIAVEEPPDGATSLGAERQVVKTPGKHTVEEVTEFLGIPASKLVKTLIYDTDQGSVAVLVRGDHSLNEAKLHSLLGGEYAHLAGEELIEKVTGAPVGFAGPVGLGDDVKIVADYAVKAMSEFVVGANEKDKHLTSVDHGRDFEVETWADLRNAASGDPCPRCGKPLEVVRGIEVGHVFYLGTKYSVALDATVLGEDGKPFPVEMGCYGIGITRTVAAAIEQNHDDHGIKWPTPIAPFQATIISANPDDDDVVGVAEKIYAALGEAGVDVLYDDRKERAGFKFKDADLIGAPYRIIVGARGLKEKVIEVKNRRTGEMAKLPLDAVVDHVVAAVRADLQSARDAAQAAQRDAK